jgi:hypothetical protein
MKYAESVYGNTGSLEKILISVICAYIVFTLLTYLKLKPVLEAVIPLNAPFKNISVLGGFLVVFWVVLAYRVCGRGYGIVTALLSVSFCLFVSPWYGVVDPYWFSVVGFASFLLLGLLTEYINGGAGNLACIALNWIAAIYAGIVKMSPDMIVLGVVAFVSGYVGDLTARKLIELVMHI